MAVTQPLPAALLAIYLLCLYVKVAHISGMGRNLGRRGLYKEATSMDLSSAKVYSPTMSLLIFVLFALTAYSKAVPTPYGYVPTVKLAPAPPPIKVAYPQQVYVEKPQPYNFGYDIKDEEGNKQWRNEAGDEYGSKKGSYGYVDAHGISRHVEYLAGPDGFKAWIKTNEPGTETSNPADVQILSEPSPVKPIAVIPKVYKPVLKAPYKPVEYAYSAPPYVPPKVIYKTSPLAIKPIYPPAVPVIKSYY